MREIKRSGLPQCHSSAQKSLRSTYEFWHHTW
jgi:hypothetical protein